MTTIQNTDTQTLSDLHDHELERHLAALGLRTIEEYVNWCAHHGFSVRVEKHWHQRCKERYFALQQDLKSRSARKKQESRHPRAVILKIAHNELAASDLTQPHLVSIAAAFASLEGDARDAFQRLLLHAQEHADLIHHAAGGPAVWHAAGNTFIDALSSLARHHGTVASARRAVETTDAQFPPPVLFAGTPPSSEIPGARFHGFRLVQGIHARSSTAAALVYRDRNGKEPSASRPASPSH